MSTELAERVQFLETALTRRTRLLAFVFVANALFAAVLVLLSMRWVESRLEGGAYLAVRPDGVIHSMTHIGGDPRTVSLEVRTFPKDGGEHRTASGIELRSTQDGSASLVVEGQQEGRFQRISLDTNTQAGPALVFTEGERRLELRADERGLFVREQAGGAAPVDYRLAREMPGVGAAQP